MRTDLEVLADLTAFLDKNTETGRRFGLSQLLEEFGKVLIDQLDSAVKPTTCHRWGRWSQNKNSLWSPSQSPN